MFRKYSRIIAAIVVCFFTWTSGGVFSIAHAAQDAVKKGKACEQQQKKAETPEERFSKVTEELEGALTDTKTDIGTKKARLTAGRDEINKLDGEMRAQFAATEQKLIAAKLPAEILERHHRFVKHYDDNLNELKGNVERVEKAKNQAEIEVEVEKTRKHLERVKAPSRHQKLDPNNLPHRQPVVKKREPRMKKEEFDQDLKKDKHAWKNQKRIQVASTGSLAGMLVSNSFNAIAQPTAADLAETVDVQLTPEIRAKALELGNNPVRIYEWVRNNIEFVPTWGSIQGAQMTMLTKQGNAFDSASLLIALLRASGIHARYVMGTVELPIDKVMNWAGGFTDPNAALNFIASGGVPVTGIRSGGSVISARMEHVWVKAWIDMIPSLGAHHKEGDTWVPLDPSFKKYTYTDGVDFQAAVPFDGQGFANQLNATSTINEQEGSVTNVNSALVQTTLSDYNTKLESYVSQNLPNATASDILGKKEIIRKDQPILPASLPYKVIVAGTETTEVPTVLRHQIDIRLIDSDSLGTVFSYSASQPQLAGKRVTISYEPATPADKAIIDSYAAQYASSIPAYLIQLKPVLRIENDIIATGPTVGMGAAQSLTISISSPRDTNVVTHNLVAGDYTAIGLNPSKISLDALQNRIDKNDYSEPIGEMLHQTALSYWAEVDAFNDVIAKTLKVRNLRHTSELTATAKVSVSSLFGVPTAATYKSRNIDVKLDNQSVLGKIIDTVKESAYMQQSGANSSFLEGAIFDQLFGKNIGDSISAVSALKRANDQGIPIYKINSSNITVLLPKLQVADEIKTEVANAVNAGLTVQIPKTNVMQLGWSGVGYIISNPVDGTGAYRISGGLNGGDSPAEGTTVIPLPQVPLTGPIAFVVGALSTSVGSILTAESGAVIAIAVPAASLMFVIATVCLIVALIVAIIKTMPRLYKQLRHYTTYLGAYGIWDKREIYESSWWPDTDFQLPGVYLTDLKIEPDTLDNRKEIATTLRIPPDSPDPNRVTSYIDILIDRMRVLLITYPIVYKHQYLFLTIIKNSLKEDGEDIIFNSHGPFAPPPVP
jgi:transglutaminase-like putative cysteine protease